jgi:hypothetical protein
MHMSRLLQQGVSWRGAFSGDFRSRFGRICFPLLAIGRGGVPILQMTDLLGGTILNAKANEPQRSRNGTSLW